MFCLPGSLGLCGIFYDDYFCLPHLDLFFITGMALPHGVFLGGNGGGMRGVGCRGFCAVFAVAGSASFAKKIGRED